MVNLPNKTSISWNIGHVQINIGNSAVLNVDYYVIKVHEQVYKSLSSRQIENLIKKLGDIEYITPINHYPNDCIIMQIRFYAKPIREIYLDIAEKGNYLSNALKVMYIIHSYYTKYGKNI